MENDKIVTDLQNLLSQVGTITKKYDQIAEITGENFNVFSILGLQDSEVRLHSNLINEFLNPKGKHSQTDLFLKLFISVINAKIDEINSKLETEIIIVENSKNISSQKIKKFKTEAAKSSVEIHTGFKNEDVTEGGRIDILVDDNNGHGIIIENKIWAGDQEKQLLRYHTYGQNKFESFHLIYLTIDGKPPSDFTKAELTKEQYFCLSYQVDILNWLELCRKECTQLPIVRETITQYINQIKLYSGQSINNKMKDEIVEILAMNDTNVNLTFEIFNSIDKVKRELMNSFLEESNIKKLRDELASYNIEVRFDDNFGTKNKVVDFINNDSLHYICIQIMDHYWDSVIGVYKKEGIELTDYCGYKYEEYVQKVRESLNILKFGKIEKWNNWVWISRNKNLFQLGNNKNAWINLKTDETINKIVFDVKAIIDNLEKNGLKL